MAGKLIDLAPASCSVLRGCTEVRVSPEDLREGDVLIVRPGERVSADA